MSTPRHKKLIVLLGPTASGKSEMAIRLAKIFNGEIVSADSRQIYKYMDIGTAKPIKNKKSKINPKRNQRFLTGQENKKHKSKIKKQSFILVNEIRHYLIDTVKPDEEFTLAQYKKMAVRAIRNIQERGKLPFLVGGTGLYIQAVVDNLKIPKAAPNEKLRERLEKLSLHELLEKLEKLDPDAAVNIDSNNKRRLIRAIEVCLTTGRPFSKQQIKGKPLFNTLQIGIKILRQKLWKRIDKRVDKMFKIGLVREVESLAKRYSWKLPSMSGIGYKEIGMYLRGEITLDEAKKLIKKNTRHYARRQMTWFKRGKKIRWIKNFKEAEKLILKFLARN